MTKSAILGPLTASVASVTLAFGILAQVTDFYSVYSSVSNFVELHKNKKKVTEKANDLKVLILKEIEIETNELCKDFYLDKLAIVEKNLSILDAEESAKLIDKDLNDISAIFHEAKEETCKKK